jgi:poly(3-hydroxybutyrate) depolymerase
MTRLISSGFCLLLAASPLGAKVFDKSAEIAGMTVHYKVALPSDYDPEKTYPAILAFPPGSQNMDMVLTTLMQNWRVEGDRRGYIVILPAAPQGRMFVGEGAKIFPEFMDKLLRDYKIRDNKFHVAGMSNGGRSAFHIAATYPQYFRSVTGLPGFLPDASPERVAALSNLCIYMHVGEFDTDWVEQMQQQAAMFQSKGYPVHFIIEKGEGHVMRTLAGEGSARLFKEIEGCKAR